MLAAPITVARFIFNIESVVHDGVSVGNSWQKETGSSCEYRTAKLNKRYYIQIRGAPTQTQEQTKEIYNTIKGTIGELQDLEPIHEAYHSPPLTHPEPIAHKERATGILIDTLTSSYAQAVIGIVTGCALLVASPFFTGIPITFFYIITALTTCITIFLGSGPLSSLLAGSGCHMAMPIIISTWAAVGLSIAQLFIPGLPVMLEAAPMMLGFFHLSRFVEETLYDRLREKIISTKPPATYKIYTKEGELADGKLADGELFPGDKICIKPGVLFPCDGTLIVPDGENALVSIVNTTTSGSPQATQYKNGDPVSKGMKILSGYENLKIGIEVTDPIGIEVAHPDGPSLSTSVEQGPKGFIQFVEHNFTKMLLTLALTSFIVNAFTVSPLTAIICATTTLVSACPCALSMVYPTIKAISNYIAEINNIVIQTKKDFTEMLRNMATAKVFILDWHGTCTEGRCSVSKIEHDDENTNTVQQLNSVINAFGHQYEHRFTHAIRTHMNEHESVCQPTITDYEAKNAGPNSTIHHGKIENKKYIFGNAEAIKEKFPINGIPNTPKDSIVLIEETEAVPTTNESRAEARETTTEAAERAATEQAEETVTNKHYQLKATIIFNEDRLPDETIEVINALKSQNITVHILSGSTIDDKHKARLTPYVDCKNIYEQQGPEAKQKKVEELQKNKTAVVFVGDSQNDALALEKANVGIAINNSPLGDSKAQQAADIQTKLSELPFIPILAQAAINRAWLALGFNIIFNIVVTAVASGLFGLILCSPWVGILLTIVETATVVLILGSLLLLKPQNNQPAGTNNNPSSLWSTCKGMLTIFTRTEDTSSEAKSRTPQGLPPQCSHARQARRRAAARLVVPPNHLNHCGVCGHNHQ